MTIALRNVTLPLAEFSLEISEELATRTTAIYGPSGAGKTSLLEIIAGLRRPTRGVVSIDGTTVFDSEKRIDVPPRRRHVGYVPQDDALFPHLSARANMLYGVAAHFSAPIGGLKPAATLENILEIDTLKERSVERLSGGERKRVALARALLSRPEILLLDEPLAGVHAELRGRVLEYLVRVRDELAIPMIYVTHELHEASAVCDEIVMLDRGRVIRRDILRR
ncbi:MAG TPA: ATP-binding cassette domain-containing protein [Thermoanaerobaculia bacterium]|nr:ATP-binding cassette domain-containing protein [Thermoanaerobaculia bacterium]